MVKRIKKIFPKCKSNSKITLNYKKKRSSSFRLSKIFLENLSYFENLKFLTSLLNRLWCWRGNPFTKFKLKCF